MDKNTSFIIEKSKTKASHRFWRMIKFYKDLPYPLKNFKFNKKFIELIPLVPTDKSYNELEEKHKKIIKEVYQNFEYLWNKYQKRINIIYQKIKKLKTKELSWLKEEIPKFTGLPWPYQKIYIYPGLCNLGAIYSNEIMIGVKPKKILTKREIVYTLIHELLHINLSKEKEKIEKKLSYPTDSEEISIIFYSNKIAQKMNKTFKINLLLEEFKGPFKRINNFNRDSYLLL